MPKSEREQKLEEAIKEMYRLARKYSMGGIEGNGDKKERGASWSTFTKVLEEMGKVKDEALKE